MLARALVLPAFSTVAVPVMTPPVSSFMLACVTSSRTKPPVRAKAGAGEAAMAAGVSMSIAPDARRSTRPSARPGGIRGPERSDRDARHNHDPRCT